MIARNPGTRKPPVQGNLLVKNMLPELKKFREAAEACHGNYSRIADVFGVTRQTVYNWCKEDPDFKEVVNDCKMRLSIKLLMLLVLLL